MAGPRKPKDGTFVSAVVVLLIFFAFIYSSQVVTLVKLGFVAIIIGGVIYFLAVHLQTNILPRRPPDSSVILVQRSTSNRTPRDRSELEIGWPSISQTKTDAVKSVKWSVELIKSLDWKCFEELCAAYFQAKGRKANVTNNGADGGIDVVLYGKSSPDKILGIVQCKAWSQKLVGVREIRELFGVMTDIGCPLGIYLTTSEYTLAAKAFAKGKHIKLMNARQLLKLINELPSDSRAHLLAKTTNGDFTTPSCPCCGIKLVSRTARSGQGKPFWGCRNYPVCRYTMRAKPA